MEYYAEDSFFPLAVRANGLISKTKNTPESHIKPGFTRCSHSFLQGSVITGAPGIEPGSGVLETLILPMNYAPKTF